MNPVVSVLIPTFNQAAFVEETVRSALDQAYDPLQVVVADDASTDGTREILERLAGEYHDRMLLIAGDRNLGITGNCNRGLARCKGDFIALQGGDDVLLPGKILAQVRWFQEHPQAVLCYHDCEIFDSETNKELCRYSAIANFSSGKGPSRIIREMRFSAAASVMLRSDAVPEYGFDPRLPMVSDWKIQIDVLAKGGTYGFVDQVLARYRRHRDNSRKAFPVRYHQDCLFTLAIVETEMPQFRKEARLARARIFGTMSIDRLAVGDRRLGLSFAGSSLRQGVFSYKFPLIVAYFLCPRRLRVLMNKALAGRVKALNYLGA